MSERGPVLLSRTATTPAVAEGGLSPAARLTSLGLARLSSLRYTSKVSANLQRVWLILTKVRIVAQNPIGLTVGSEALVQCFIPETVIEAALSQIDRLLQSEGMRRVDVITCSSFDKPEDEDESPDFVKQDIHRARSCSKPLTGTFFTSPDSATFETDERQDG